MASLGDCVESISLLQMVLEFAYSKHRTGKCAILENSGESLRKALASILIALAGKQNEATLCLSRINCARLTELPSALTLWNTLSLWLSSWKILLSEIFQSRECLGGSGIFVKTE